MRTIFFLCLLFIFPKIGAEESSIYDDLERIKSEVGVLGCNKEVIDFENDSYNQLLAFGYVFYLKEAYIVKFINRDQNEDVYLTALGKSGEFSAWTTDSKLEVFQKNLTLMEKVKKISGLSGFKNNGEKLRFIYGKWSSSVLVREEFNGGSLGWKSIVILEGNNMKDKDLYVEIPGKVGCDIYVHKINFTED
ncbi:hypothetical protein [Pleionea litopenaei]|uniref:Uncharacterized protein n=1 Tax=Pleionea litopenaei TaxID=3070815 RepID=A0AA51X6V1_9GAMM|nr:hypothetical protein [Pleionea sp. HL-JVS1]WMS87518.1 hypothetical protein Q9312_00985 [Pleionea sp. HL-JVS1]